MKFILTYLFISLLSISSSFAFENVDVISRYNNSTAISQNAVHAIRALNEMQSEYRLRYTHIPGANGETAVVSSLEYSRAGRSILWFGPISTFTTTFVTRNGEKQKNWSENDFYFVSGVSTGIFAVLVSPNNDAKNFEEFVKNLQKKDKVFNGNNVSSTSSLYLGKLFSNKFNLRNKTIFLDYRQPNEIAQALLSGEIDYTIRNIVDLPSLRPIAILNETRAPSLPNIPTAKELGVEELTYESLSVFAIPKNDVKLIKALSPLIFKLCNNSDLDEGIIKRNFMPRTCVREQEILKRISEEKEDRNPI
jgi:tripartite-type tricarboxylate transporter receptor subunit TctC